MKVKLDIRDWANVAPQLRGRYSQEQHNMTENDVFTLSRELWDAGLNVAVIRSKTETLIFAYKLEDT